MMFMCIVYKYFVPPKGSSRKDLEREKILLHRAEIRAQTPLPGVLCYVYICYYVYAMYNCLRVFALTLSLPQ